MAITEGVKRVPLSSATREIIGGASQKYEMPMQMLIDLWIAFAGREYQQGNRVLVATMRYASREYHRHLDQRLRKARAAKKLRRARG